MHLLTLTHRDRATLNTRLLGQIFNLIGRIGAHAEEADERRARVALFKRRLEVEDDGVGVALALRLGDVLARLRHGAVRAPHPVRVCVM